MAGRKVKQQKEIEQLSPEALEKEIENNKRKIVQSIVFIAAAAIALIAIWVTRGTGPLAFYRGPLAQFMSPVAHTHKCKNCAEEMENQTNFSVQQPVRVFLKI